MKPPIRVIEVPRSIDGVRVVVLAEAVRTWPHIPVVSAGLVFDFEDHYVDDDLTHYTVTGSAP